MDCDWGKKNADVSGKYGVRGYPTVLFTDPRGEVVSKLAARDASSVAKQIYELAKKYRGTAGGGATAELPWAKSYDAGMTEAVKSGKHMLVLFTDGKATAQATEAALAQKELLQHLSKYVLVRQQISRDDAVCKEHRVTTGVQIRVLDPKAPTKPLLRLTGKKTTKSIESSLSRLAKQLDSDREI